MHLRVAKLIKNLFLNLKKKKKERKKNIKATSQVNKLINASIKKLQLWWYADKAKQDQWLINFYNYTSGPLNKTSM